MQRRTFYLITLLVFIVLGLLACDLGTLSSSKPTVIISSPPSGSQYRDGEDVAVQSTSTDSTGIVRVELSVDGTVVRTDPSPSAQVSYPLIQTWKATPGTHTIAVRAFNTANIASDPAAVSISVLTASGATPLPPTIIPNLPVGTQVPTATLLPPVGASPTSTSPAVPGACTNFALFVADVTVPDGTAFASGQTFNKIWRLRNTGT
ncbi:MAG: Ig-like domain-containing protein, partial [Acidobacteriota bacterium]